MAKKEVILDPETLDKIWQDWQLRDKDESPMQVSSSDLSRRMMRFRGYQNEWRDGYRTKPFEDWLWQNGFKVIQRDKKRYLKYIGTPAKLTMFLLKYGGGNA